RDVAPPALVQPPGHPLRQHRRGDRIDAPGQSLAGHEDVRLDAESLHAPEVTGSPETGLHLVRDQERSVLVTDAPHATKVVVGRYGKAIGGGNRLEDDRGHVAVGESRGYRVDVGERNLAEVRRVR